MLRKILILLLAFAIGAGIGVLAPGYHPPPPPRAPVVEPECPEALPPDLRGH